MIKTEGSFFSIATLTGRTKVRFVVKGSEDILNDSDMPGLNIEDPKWRFGEAKLLFLRRKMVSAYFYNSKASGN